jgi:NAD(P)-dependent dehydrogenase (short-subunit alcohol dehydrogenase family)
MTDFLTDLFSLKGETAIVTGASRGIGYAVADTLSAAEAEVFALARSERPPFPFKNRVNYQSCDITDINRFKQICDKIFTDQGSIDILVNCAGISLPADIKGQSANFQKTVNLNLVATYNVISYVAFYMKKNNSGTIINITSLASIMGIPGNPGYVASKAGLGMLTKGLAIDLAKDNIRVNNIVPGYILTDMTRKSYSDKNLKKLRDQRMIKNRWGYPKDLAGAVILLASGASDYITGTDIIVDGGWTAKGLGS